MKKFFSLLLAAAMLFALAACSNGDSEYPVKIANYTFTEKPKSIICLNDSVADILIACGYADRITARSDECTQQELKDVPSVGTQSRPNSQKILDINPDVIFADKNLVEETRKKIEAYDIKVLTIADAATAEDVRMLYTNIGAVVDGDKTGRKKGEDSADSVLLTLDDLQRLVPEREVETTACYIYDISGTSANKDTFSGQYFDYANAINICENTSGSNMIDTIKLSDPQYIFCAIGLKDTLLADDNLKNLSAVKNGNIFEINALEFRRRGNSMAKVLTFMIESMYPEISQSDESSQLQESKQESSKEESKEESLIEVKADHSLEITEDIYFGFGEETEDFKKVQNRLKALGYFNEEATGYFGELSQKAFMIFEKTNGLEVNGEISYDDLILLFSANAKPNGYKEESSKQESSKQESSKQESSKQESSKQESSKQESSKQESSKQESSKQESSKQENSKQESITVKADNSLTITEDTMFGLGDNDEDFKKVQKRLKALRYFNDDETGYFGEVSLKAFKAFEKANGLDEDGFASPEDLALLFSDKAKAAQ